ncbi:aminotransferase class V-fold PLP-dependent enzyme [Candidatus Micrarchaeota archaeon]|nr:aminotransferase class V-fold PLP-dependent enzyme [Candidatus Micrarchaeota archaeon]MBD3417771.1 aminotransferase class V-fold PLP-dependent enzyme [Candidatus Micrarchaeota archaeon]
MSILLSPGPVYVPEEILLEQAKPMITHRSPEFTELYGDICERLRSYLNSEEAFVITGSGTLANEANVLNCCLHEENMLVLSNGEFGDRLAEIGEVYTNVEKHSLPAGKGWNIERAKEFIDNSEAQVFGMVYNETGYGVANHAKEIFQYAKSKGMFTIMDSVSAWPALPFNQSEYQVDFFGSASQKALGCPPGMGIVGMSKSAIERIESRDRIPSVYCDLRKHRKRYLKNQQTPNTPAISLFRSMRKAFDTIDKEGGMPAWNEKHNSISAHVRSRIKSLGLKLIPEPGYESPALTAFYCDNADSIKKRMLEEREITIVGCKGELKGKGLRIAHMGQFKKENLDICIDSLGEFLK